MAGSGSDARRREDLVLVEGERYPVGERMHTLTPRLAEATARSRAVLVDAAAHREVVTYGELSELIGGLVLPRHMGPLLHMVSHDCAARGEPDLPAREVGTPDGSWAPPQRLACWERWGRRD